MFLLVFVNTLYVLMSQIFNIVKIFPDTPSPFWVALGNVTLFHRDFEKEVFLSRSGLFWESGIKHAFDAAHPAELIEYHQCLDTKDPRSLYGLYGCYMVISLLDTVMLARERRPQLQPTPAEGLQRLHCSYFHCWGFGGSCCRSITTS